MPSPSSSDPETAALAPTPKKFPLGPALGDALIALALDGVVSPHSRRAYAHALGHFRAWCDRACTPRPGQSRRPAIPGFARSRRPVPFHDQRPVERHPQGVPRGGRQRVLFARFRSRNRTGQRGAAPRHPDRQLARPRAGRATSLAARWGNAAGKARPGPARPADRLRAAPRGTRRTRLRPHPAARRPLGGGRSGRQRQTRSHRPDARLDQSRHRSLDRCRRHHERPPPASRQ